jgi:hypothetical protein
VNKPELLVSGELLEKIDAGKLTMLCICAIEVEKETDRLRIFNVKSVPVEETISILKKFICNSRYTYEKVLE